jgi:hypothetical protein
MISIPSLVTGGNASGESPLSPPAGMGSSRRAAVVAYRAWQERILTATTVKQRVRQPLARLCAGLAGASSPMSAYAAKAHSPPYSVPHECRT